MPQLTDSILLDLELRSKYIYNPARNLKAQILQTNNDENADYNEDDDEYTDEDDEEDSDEEFYVPKNDEKQADTIAIYISRTASSHSR